ncbi:hypothetical protein T08_3621 [Trichinella sp. T8]|nr:hypothetical protein T08_3621 [Trichinella sp. T8]
MGGFIAAAPRLPQPDLQRATPPYGKGCYTYMVHKGKRCVRKIVGFDINSRYCSWLLIVKLYAFTHLKRFQLPYNTGNLKYNNDRGSWNS